MDGPIREVKDSGTASADSNIKASSQIVARRTPRLTHGQRQVEELYDLYDFLILDRLLKSRSTPEEHTGSWAFPPRDRLPPLGTRGFFARAGCAKFRKQLRLTQTEAPECTELSSPASSKACSRCEAFSNDFVAEHKQR